jgi:hypothetical protein
MGLRHIKQLRGGLREKNWQAKMSVACGSGRTRLMLRSTKPLAYFLRFVAANISRIVGP